MKQPSLYWLWHFDSRSRTPGEMVTSTTTEKGTTKWVTTIATSTVVVTSCVGGCGGVVTVPGPTGWETTTTDVFVTYTTTCPVEETITAPGTTYTKTYTTTSVVETGMIFKVHRPTTIRPYCYWTTSNDCCSDRGYRDSYQFLCPVTDTTTISGKEVTVTYTTTSYYTTNVPTHFEVTTTAPEKTETAITGVYSTITSLCPVTETKTISGSVATVTYTTTSYIVTKIGTTVEASVTLPPKTTTIETGVLQTITTSLSHMDILPNIPRLLYHPQTQTVETEVLQTITSLFPITEIQTISGIIYTVTKTSTSLIVTHGYHTDYSQTTLPPQTKTTETYAYQTSTVVYPVSQVQTVSGIPITKVFTSTIYTEVKVPTTVVQYTTTQANEYKTTDVYETTTCIENVYTTVSAGSTIVLTATETNTIKVTSVHTFTSTLPAATGKVTVYVPTTIDNTIETIAVVTVPSVVKTVTIPQPTGQTQPTLKHRHITNPAP
ncbi:hypothetical protein DID88_000358 [Monilinia fructigena]|uniref:Uncharacterized protein n=1 Tax=Monilinia fructigena TaxID=38457 RepID=A0A395IHT0_9HELO|nr:hypothetical protein DID88_000358 [Monilinia fructigena]